MEKLTILTSYRWPMDQAPSNRISAIVSAASDYYTVNVITSALGDRKPDKKINLINLDIDKLPKSINLIKRAIEEMSILSKYVKELNRLPNDGVVIVTIPSVFLVFLFPFAKKGNRHFVLDIRDLVWEYLPNKVIYRILVYFFKKIFKLAIRDVALLFVTNPVELQKLKSMGVKSKILVAPNGIERKMLDSYRSVNREAVKNQQPISILYIGNVGRAQSLLSFVESIEEASNIELHIIGDGNAMTEVEEYVHEKNVDHVFLHGRMKREEIIKWYSSADLLMASVGSDYQSAVPSKLYEYLSTGKPIAFSGGIAAREVLDKFSGIYYFDISMAGSFVQILSLKDEWLGESYYEERAVLLGSEFLREEVSRNMISAILELQYRKPHG